MTEDSTKIEWVHKLKEDMVRVNRAIKKVKLDVDDGIDRLKLLEQERKDLVDKCLDDYDE
jgi:hypothetical protein